MNFQFTSRFSNMTLRGAICFYAVFLVNAPVSAEERVVHGQVTKVVPITETQPQTKLSSECQRRKPVADFDLGILLRWDLLPDCDAVTTATVTGYEVFYRWDNRTYSRKMAQHPGATVPLMLTVD